jgi:hypothetical protein
LHAATKGYLCRSEEFLTFSLGIAVNTAMTVTNVEHYWRNHSLRNFLAVTCLYVTVFLS